MPVPARRILGIVVAVLGVTLSVIGAWTALRLGPSGEARFSVASKAPGAVVIGPNVLNSLDVPVRVTATRSDGGAVLVVAGPSSDARAVLGKAAVSTVRGVLPAGTLDLRASGTGALTDISTSGVLTDIKTSDVWRLSATGSGSAQLVVDKGLGPETAVVTSGDASPLRDVTTTLTWADPTWFFKTLSAGVIGAILAAFALGDLWRTRISPGTRTSPSTRTSPGTRTSVVSLMQGPRNGPDGMTRRVRAIALSVATVVSITGCGAGRAVLGIHEAPQANAASVPLTVDQAQRILTRDFTAAQQGETSTGPAARAALRTAYAGQGLSAANARLKLVKVQPPVADSPLLAPQQPRLLALSRGFAYPRVMVAQTLPPEGPLPILHLLTSPDAATPYRIIASAAMLPGSSVERFDPLTEGSPLVTDGTKLAVTDTVLLKAYASGMAFPPKAVTNPPFEADPFSAQLRANAAAVARAVAAQASFSQVHTVVPKSSYAIRQASGGALVFGVIERTDSFEVKPGQAVNTSGNSAFVLLTGKKRVTKAASISWLEFVVFSVPPSAGRATLVAATEQVVAGAGS